MRGISDSNTKVYGVGYAPFSNLVSFFLWLEQASENTGSAMRKQINEFTPYSVGKVHDPLLFFVTPVKFLSILL